MPPLGTLLEALLQNAASLLFMLPAVGALLAFASAPLGVDAVRRTAQSNALVTALFAVAAVSHHVAVDSPRLDGRTAETRAWNWTATPQVTTTDTDRKLEWTGPRVQFVFGMDGTNAWFVLLAVCGVFPVLQLAPADDDSRGLYVLLLLVQACTLGAFLATDVLLFCLLSETSVLLTFLLIGTYGGHERRAVAGRWLVTQATAGVLVLVGLMLVVLLRTWSLADENGANSVSFRVLDLQRFDDSVLWADWAPWVFPLLLAGLTLRAAAFPLHTWFVPVSQESPRPLALLLLVAGTKVGLYGVVRFVVPVFPEACTAALPVLTSVAVTGVVFAGLLTLAQGNLSKFVSCISLAFFSSALLATFTLTPKGLSGAVLTLVHHGCAIGLLAYVVHSLAERYDTYDVEAYGGLARRFPRLALLCTVSILAAAGVPGTLGFVGQLLVASSLFATSGRLLFGQMLGTFLLTWALLWTWNRLFRGRFREPVVGDPGSGRFPRPESHRAEDLGWSECLSAVPLLVLLFGLGCWPKPVVDSVGASASVVLESYELDQAVPVDSAAE